MENTHGGVLILLKLQASACNFTKINTPSWVFFTFFKLHKWYQIAQRTTNSISLPLNTSSFEWVLDLTTFEFRRKATNITFFHTVLHWGSETVTSVQPHETWTSDTAKINTHSISKCGNSEIITVYLVWECAKD